MPILNSETCLTEEQAIRLIENAEAARERLARHPAIRDLDGVSDSVREYDLFDFVEPPSARPILRAYIRQLEEAAKQ